MSTAQRQEIARLHKKVAELEKENQELKRKLREAGLPRMSERERALRLADALFR